MRSYHVERTYTHGDDHGFAWGWYNGGQNGFGERKIQRRGANLWYRWDCVIWGKPRPSTKLLGAWLEVVCDMDEAYVLALLRAYLAALVMVGSSFVWLMCL